MYSTNDKNKSPKTHYTLNVFQIMSEPFEPLEGVKYAWQPITKFVFNTLCYSILSGGHNVYVYHLCLIPPRQGDNNLW